MTSTAGKGCCSVVKLGMQKFPGSVSGISTQPSGEDDTKDWEQLIHVGKLDGCLGHQIRWGAKYKILNYK